MDKAKGRRAMRASALASAIVLVLALASCAPNGASTVDEGASAGNDTAVKGEYTPYDPAKEAELTAGKAIEGSDEEKLQQERIAGGAVDTTIKSQNLEPLEGIVDGSEGSYVPRYGMEDQAPAMGHDGDRTECLSCHEGEGTSVRMPASHEDAGLGNEECASCHEAE
ncbi:hypothetical protein B5F40_06030 [Gordonibacter sp. An230]|uniref:hypothetical protein n=1 Tax=Gordonibacter sp. An230 TaxID=1965592 RepID=UPI000B37E108|nr:hypothetical protein [Gordonibacter sp. An230]OUO90745.1 hypothetical protein B5F40_06030 [Gordonibacter sp. An230]